MTAFLFSLPRQRRSLSVMRDAVLRRLESLMPGGGSPNEYEWDWQVEESKYSFAVRLEKLLACIENKLAPHLATRRDQLAVEAEQRRKAEQLACECEAESRADAIREAIDADPRVVTALADYESANQKLLAVIAVEEEAERAMLAAPFPENVPLRTKLIPIRGKTTRARNAANRAYGDLAALRDRVRRSTFDSITTSESKT